MGMLARWIAIHDRCKSEGLERGLLFPRDTKKSFKMRMNKSSTCAAIACKPMPIQQSIEYWTAMNTLVTSAVTPTYPQKKEEPMINMESDQRNYLERRIYDVMETKDRELRRAFGLSDDNHPENVEESIARIKAGEYMLRDKDSFWGQGFDRIRWRKPDAVEDRAGYEAAKKRMDVASEELSDKARLYSIADATKAFEEFKATDFRSA